MREHRRPALPDRFQIEGEIGRGGMAVVYRAHDRELGRPVAIKLLSEQFSSAIGGERFRREIAVMAKLVHPRIVTLVDSGQANGRLYYVMPFITGETLRARLTREQRLSPDAVRAFGADIAEALAFAHGMGVIHRDVKPENVFAIGDRAMLADFGIARVMDDSVVDRSSYRTTTGVAVATMAYMSPVQAKGRAADGVSSPGDQARCAWRSSIRSASRYRPPRPRWCARTICLTNRCEQFYFKIHGKTGRLPAVQLLA